MREIRDLLMDCRIELRTHVRDFHKTELCKRIDDVRDALLHGGLIDAPAPTTTEAADRVAVAWQLAAEDLKLTAPAIYELLAKKVGQRMANLPVLDVAADHGIETEATEQGLQDVADVQSASSDVVAAELTKAAEVAAVLPEPDSHIPSVEALESIAASKRRFSESQREWCVGEAMVRSGFSIDPEEFIARGDNEMAKYILESVEEQ